MKYFGIGLLLFAFPFSALGAACSPDGFTVVYINGMNTSVFDMADEDKNTLKNEFKIYSGLSNVNFLTGYNPSHFGGGGDDAESVAQALGRTITNLDRNTILMQIAPDVKTQKILFVGHSQGAFYANELYEYLTSHGVSKDSIAVYAVATPASFVKGGGRYLTSANDTVIDDLRERMAFNDVPQPLSANILLKKDATEPLGHRFSPIYLAQAAPRIVADMEKGLGGLKSAGADTDSACFTPPEKSVGYMMQKSFFTGADIVADASPVVAVTMKTTVDAGIGVVAAARFSGLAVGNAMSAAVAFAGSILPSPTKQTAINAFPVVRFLYGSGLDQPGLNDLNDDATFYSGTAPPRRSSAVALAPAAPRPASQAPAPPPPASQPPAPPKPAEPSNPLPTLLPVSPGLGGGGAGASQPEPEPPPASPPPATASALVIISPAADALYATTSVSIIGTSTPAALIFASFSSTLSTTTSDGAGNWAFSLTLSEGTTTVSLSVLDAGASGTTTLSRSVTIDTAPPSAPTLSIAECADSLATSDCLLPRTSATLSWSDISDAASYAIASGGTWLGTTTATTAVATLTDQSTAHFEIVALDLAGNVATSSAVNAAAYLQPIVINEVAWAGTDSDPDNQWLELKNRTSYDLDLSQLALYSPDSTVYVPLTGTIGGSAALLHGNLALIYKNSAPLAGAVHQQQDAALSFATSAPVQLALAWASGGATTTLDSTPAADVCTSWCAGAYQTTTGFAYVPGGSGVVLPTSLSMERTDASAGGTLAGSWGSNDQYTTSGQDSFGGAIAGTPGAENSSHFGESGFFCDGDSGPVADGASYHLQTANCTVLSRFIYGGASRATIIYVGTPPSAGAQINGFLLANRNFSQYMDMSAASGMSSGDPFSIAIFENRPYSTDLADFDSYFKGTLPAPPHDNYRVIQLAYQ